jgi:PBP1b-binding outer membrane lipoprotein LpoB
MKKLIILPLIAATAFGLSACTKHTETENVTINDTSTNLDAPVDTNLTDNAAEAPLDNSAVTNG